MLVVVDTGPLYASLDLDDADHDRSIEALSRPQLRLVIPVLVVAEVSYLTGTRLGPSAEARFLATLGELDVEAPTPEDWGRISELVRTYADFPLGATDAAVIALAERLDTDTVCTLDRRHFTAVRPRHVESFQLLP